jgi:hypothetical protein
MSEPLVVEIWGKPAGVILREGNAFRFHAFAQPFSELEGTEFSTLGHARLAAAKLQPADIRPHTTPQTIPTPNWLS